MPQLQYDKGFIYETSLRILGASCVHNWGDVATMRFYDALYTDMKKNIQRHTTNRKANINGEVCFAYRFDPYWVFYTDEGAQRVIKYFRHEKESIEWI
jgi:hypothetical protein